MTPAVYASDRSSVNRAWTLAGARVIVAALAKPRTL
jgi:hypothetical protein